MRRKRISDKTKLAASLLDRGEIPYEHAKLMGQTNFLSLYQYDHNILHESGHPDRDEFWNLKPRLIREHREKTKRDAKIIAKGRRLRRKRWTKSAEVKELSLGYVITRKAIEWRKLQSRGFDKTRRRKMDGTVVKR
jgi:hypothetical protein